MDLSKVHIKKLLYFMVNFSMIIILYVNIVKFMTV